MLSKLGDKKSTLLTDKSASTSVTLKMKICQTSNCLKDYKNQFLENLKK